MDFVQEQSITNHAETKLKVAARHYSVYTTIYCFSKFRVSTGMKRGIYSDTLPSVHCTPIYK